MELEQVVSLFRMLQFERNLEKFRPHGYQMLGSIPDIVTIQKGRSVGMSRPYNQLLKVTETMTKPLIDADFSGIEVRIMGGIKDEKPNKRWYHKFDKRRKY